ncbi:unnamed protein product [Moneuplotes crassus]|uniref:Uncharacterized protein n=1 Tax=Euplotes crassus TaxID=5936 RepID=A0AAD1X9Z8_EUPCR|nr:unnamed protein product [Moneuplotes crassus]
MSLHCSVDRSKFASNEYQDPKFSEEIKGVRKSKKRFLVKSRSSKLTTRESRNKKTVRFALDPEDLIEQTNFSKRSLCNLKPKEFKILSLPLKTNKKNKNTIKRSQSHLLMQKDCGKFKNGNLALIKKNIPKFLKTKSNIQQIRQRIKNSQPSLINKFRAKYPINIIQNKSTININEKKVISTSSLKNFKFGCQNEKEEQNLSQLRESQTYDSRVSDCEVFLQKEFKPQVPCPYKHIWKGSSYKPPRNSTEVNSPRGAGKLTPEFYKALLRHGTSMRESTKEKSLLSMRASISPNEYSTQTSIERQSQKSYFQSYLHCPTFRKNKVDFLVNYSQQSERFVLRQAEVGSFCKKDSTSPM